MPEFPKIDEATKEAWITALESGQWPQTANMLYDGTGYCCLGVLCRVKGGEFTPRMFDVEDDEGNVTSQPSEDEYEFTVNGHTISEGNDLLDGNFAEELGMTGDHQGLLSSLNDGTTSNIPVDSPLLPIWRKVATEATGDEAASAASVGMVKFYIDPPRSFAEIAQVIREHF
jgi:hypothetical protein